MYSTVISRVLDALITTPLSHDLNERIINFGSFVYSDVDTSDSNRHAFSTPFSAVSTTIDNGFARFLVYVKP